MSRRLGESTRRHEPPYRKARIFARSQCAQLRALRPLRPRRPRQSRDRSPFKGEYRIDWGPGYRVYLVKDGEDLVILLAGGKKQRQQADIERAKILWAEYKARKAALKSKRR